ncbi:MAG: hypothetical protein ACT4OM_04905 [Actinomycetota bacterium]
MDSVDPYCVNHPKTATRVRCSNCDDPICVRCMVNSAVGQKCRKCSRIQYQSSGPHSRRRYLAGGAGMLAAAGLQLGSFFVPLGILGLIMPLLIGYLTGTVVKRVGGWGMASAAAIAAVCGIALGYLVAGAPLGIVLHPRMIFTYGIAAYIAHYRANR